MKKLELMQQKASEAVLKRAHVSAKQSAGLFCRWWLGAPKVPQALIDQEK